MTSLLQNSETGFTVGTVLGFLVSLKSWVVTELMLRAPHHRFTSWLTAYSWLKDFDLALNSVTVFAHNYNCYNLFLFIFIFFYKKI